MPLDDMVGCSIRILILRMVQVELRYILRSISYPQTSEIRHETHWKIVLLLPYSCILYQAFSLESPVNLNRKATFFFSPHGGISRAFDHLYRSDCRTGISVQLLVFTFVLKWKFIISHSRVFKLLSSIQPVNMYISL